MGMPWDVVSEAWQQLNDAGNTGEISVDRLTTV